jgi:hypothetical protein
MSVEFRGDLWTRARYEEVLYGEVAFKTTI